MTRSCAGVASFYVGVRSKRIRFFQGSGLTDMLHKDCAGVCKCEELEMIQKDRTGRRRRPQNYGFCFWFLKRVIHS